MTFKQVTKSQIDRFYVELDSTKTNGHTFCEMLVDVENCRFTAVLYDGEAYSFKYDSTNYIQDLIHMLQTGTDRLYMKLRDARLDDVIDIEATVNAMMKHIEESDAYKDDPNHFDSLELMREDIESVFENNAPVYTHTIWGVWHEWFTPFVNDGLLPGDGDELYESFNDLIHREGDRNCRIFCQLIAPILADVLKEVYEVGEGN